MERKKRVILSGGGTGGHIYPAVAVAQTLEKIEGESVELLFVGALGRMEMRRVPELGYRIKGVPVSGIERRMSLKNLLLPFKVMKSVRISRRIIDDFGADVVVGFGGYASGPVLWAAQRKKIPTLIQEQNSYAGVTNKILGKRAKKVCVAHDGMERFFPKESVVFTGNPLRGNFSEALSKRGEALKYFGFTSDKPVLLIVGGSLGTRSLNEMMKKWVDDLQGEPKYQVIWQTGEYYRAEMDVFMAGRDVGGLWRGAFIDRMDYAYSAADVVISRSGAGAISELCLVGKPTIFIPSPNVAEDHQTKNAMALVSKGAAVMVTDANAREQAMGVAEGLLLGDQKGRVVLTEAIKKLAVPDSADRVAKEILALIKE